MSTKGTFRSRKLRIAPLRVALTLLALCLSLSMSACAALTPEPAWKNAVEGDGPGNLALVDQHFVQVSNLPKSRSGNRSGYEVFGQRYEVLDSAKGFTQTGVASWYGSKFHGRATASGEIYDMHLLTAAHKNLPLPTFARVTRVDNGRSIVVKINDRGPFVGDRIIDLSFGAAAALDMLESGKAEVVVEAISDHDTTPQMASTSTEGSRASVAAAPQQQGYRFVQVGAFSESANAQALIERVDGATGLPAQMDFESTRELYRVMVGPLADSDSVDAALQRLSLSGIQGYEVQKSAH